MLKDQTITPSIDLDPEAFVTELNARLAQSRRELEDRIVALYRNGASLAAIQDGLAVSRRETRSILRARGIAIHPRGAIGITHEQRASILQLSAQGESVRKIAAQVGLSLRRAYEIIRAAGRPGRRRYGKCGIELSPRGMTAAIDGAACQPTAQAGT